MAREVAFRSLDCRDVEPLLANASGGSDPAAVVVWEELQSGLNSKLSPADLETALANLFEEVLLTNGVTEERNGTDDTPYFFTRFTATVPGWTTDKINEIALIERDTGIQRNYSHLFRATAPGTFFVEFQSKRSNPVIPDDVFLLRVQRLPEPGVSNRPVLPDWIADDAGRIGNAFYQVFVSVNADGSVIFRNGTTVTNAQWDVSDSPTQERLIGVRYNPETAGYEVI